jgi:hypothetical protein
MCLIICYSVFILGDTFSVPLHIQERSGIQRVMEPVLNGIPLPQEAGIHDLEGLSLIDADSGQILTADFMVLSRWGGGIEDEDAPIKWVLVYIPVSISAQGEMDVILTDYRPEAYTESIVLNQQGTLWTIDTGKASFELDAHHFTLFERVLVDGHEVISSNSNGGFYYQLDAQTWRASQCQSSSGLDISVVQRGIHNQFLTLKIKGSHRTFSPGDPIYSTDEDIDFNVFLTFYANQSKILVYYTVQNNRDWVPMLNNAEFRNIGSPHTVWADSIGLDLNLISGADPVWSYQTSLNSTPHIQPLTQLSTLYQDSSGTDHWDLWRNEHQTGSEPTTHPIFGPSSYVSFKGFRVHQGTELIEQGNQMSGYIAFKSSLGGLTVALDHFWQNYPKAISVDPNGQFRIEFFPAAFRSRHGLRVGEQKTQKLMMSFTGPGEEIDESSGMGFQDPLVLLAPANWYGQACKVIQIVSTETDGSYRFETVAGKPSYLVPDVTPDEWDNYMVRHLEGPGGNAYSFSGLDEAVQASEMYSWMDYGDIPIDFEGQWETFPDSLGCGGRERSHTGQYGWKYNGDFGLFLNFLRSADFRFYSYAQAAVQHTADIDILHHGRQSGRGIHSFLDGGTFGHSEHNTAGDFNPHRNGTDATYDAMFQSCTNNPDNGGAYWNGTPTADIHYGAPALAIGYLLTGNSTLLESLLDLGNWAVAYIPQWGTDANRSSANLLETLTWVFDVTGDLQYRQAADAMLEENSVFNRPMDNSWISGMLGNALARYVRLIRTWGDHSMDSRLSTVVKDADAYCEHYTYDMARADSFAQAALLLTDHKSNTMDKARTCFECAVLEPAWLDNYNGISIVWQIKEWVGALRWSGGYEDAVYELQGGDPFLPTPYTVEPSGGASNQNEAPSISVFPSGTQTIGTDEVISFDLSASSDLETQNLLYWIDFGDGTISKEPSAHHQYKDPGTWTAYFYVSDGESVSSTHQLVNVHFVNQPPQAVITGEDRSAPVEVPVFFSASSSSDPDMQELSFNWDFGDSSQGQGMEVFHSFSQTGVYRVQLWVSDGDLETTTIIHVTILPVQEESQTRIFQDGLNSYEETRDVRLWSKAPNSNYGAATELFVGRQNYPELRSLIYFELSGVPEGARIEEATLSLHSSRSPDTPSCVVNRVTSSWLEGSGDGTPAQNGASWQTRDGAMEVWNESGGDFDSFQEMSFMPPAVDSVIEIDVTGIVQNWVLGTENNGFMIRSPVENYAYAYFYSREALVSGYRPRLEVQFSPLEEDVCHFQCQPDVYSVSSSGGLVSTQVLVEPSCPWQCRSSFSWLQPLISESQSGPGTCEVMADSNPYQQSRIGSFSIESCTVQVFQVAAPPPPGMFQILDQWPQEESVLSLLGFILTP